jgi:hypothetical protein
MNLISLILNYFLSKKKILLFIIDFKYFNLDFKILFLLEYFIILFQFKSAKFNFYFIIFIKKQENFKKTVNYSKFIDAKNQINFDIFIIQDSIINFNTNFFNLESIN